MNETIMFYINAIHDGGAERVIIQLAYHFSEIGYRSILVTSFRDKDEYPIPKNVERISMEEKEKKQSRLKRNSFRIRKLREFCKKYNPTVLISFMAEPNFRSLIATIGLPVKTIVSVRNDPNMEYKGKMGYLVGKYLIPHADGCVFQTEDAKKWFPQKIQERSKVIFNDVDRKFFETDYIGGKDIVTLGRLSVQKNQILLIEAFSKITNIFPDVDLLVYGKGELEETLLRVIHKYHLSNRVKLMGLTNDAADVLAHARIFVLSSDYEGMPNALLEALAIGVPCISTDCPCGGPRNVIENGVNGILIPTGDVSSLSKALIELISKSDYANQLGKNARKSARRYKTDAVFSEWKDYVESVIRNEN